MSGLLRRVLAFVLFLLFLALMVASQSGFLDHALLYGFWAGLIICSGAAVVKRARSSDTGYGQLSALPRSWRSWILSESAQKARR